MIKYQNPFFTGKEISNVESTIKSKNLIEINNAEKDNIPNYGWPISSAGEHYGGRIDFNKDYYLKYPLHKSHIDFGFIEPLISFVPSIGISEIVKIGQNKYIVSSLRDQSIYFFELDNQNIIVNFERIEVFERIRDLKFLNDQLYPPDHQSCSFYQSLLSQLLLTELL